MSTPFRNSKGWIDVKATLAGMDQDSEEDQQPLLDLDASKPSLTPAQRALCQMAVADPSSLIRADKTWITGLPPPEEEDALLQSKLGTTKDGLIHKALNTPDELSERECEVLVHGADYDREGIAATSNFQRLFGLRAEDAKLKRAAHDAVITPDELRACAAASRRDSVVFRPARSAARQNKSAETREAIQAARAKRQEIIERRRASVKTRQQQQADAQVETGEQAQVQKEEEGDVN